MPNLTPDPVSAPRPLAEVLAALLHSHGILAPAVIERVDAELEQAYQRGIAKGRRLYAGEQPPHCPRCGAVRPLHARYDICGPCVRAEGWDEDTASGGTEHLGAGETE